MLFSQKEQNMVNKVVVTNKIDTQLDTELLTRFTGSIIDRQLYINIENFPV